MNNQFPPLVLRASAGTGKTYRLTGRLLAILIADGDISSILATTFTRKAAGEILERLLTALASAATRDESLADLRKQVDRPTLTQAQCRLLLHRLLRDIHRTRICTLDSLFSQLARSFPFELQLPPGWRLTDELEELWLRRRAVHATLSAIDPNELATLVAMLGKGDAVRSVDTELHAIIQAGYGHSRWTDEKAWKSLPKTKAPDANLLQQAAETLEQAAVGHKSADKNIQAMAELLLSDQRESLADKQLIADAAAHADDGDPLLYYKKPIPDDILKALRLAYDAARADVLGLLSEQTEATGEILRHYAQHIESLKQQRRVLAFDDVAFRLAQWIDSLDFEVLQQRLDASISHVLLDEFQDTAPVQWAVLKPLAQRAARAAEQHSFFCVGDTKQAIYGWRGGQAAIFDAVEREITGVESDTLAQSFRSSPVISDFVSRVFRHLDRHPRFDPNAKSKSKAKGDRSKDAYEARAVRQFAKAFPVHESAKQSLKGYVSLETCPTSDAKGAGAAELRRIERFTYAAQRIADIAHSAPQNSIGVLTRKNQSVAELIYLLKQHDLDVSQEGGNPLTDSALVELLLSALMMVEHPADLRWAFHVSNSPLAGLLDLPQLTPQLRGTELVTAVSRAADQIRERVEHEGLTATLLWLGDALIPIAGRADATRLRQLVNLAHDYQLNPQPRLAAFVERVRFQRVERPQPAQIRVMTVHQAKGLEFDAVVLPELDADLVRQGGKIVSRSDSPMAPPAALLRYISSARWAMLPKVWQTALGEAAASSMTEALCLLYVAVTRPRQALYMVIDPPTRPEFETKTASALIFHALSPNVDPTEPETVLFEMGDPQWYAQETAGTV